MTKPINNLQKYKGSGRHIRPQEYKNIKDLTNVIDNRQQIATIFNRSISTVSRIRDSKNYEDYRAFMNSINPRNNKPEPQAKPTLQVTKDPIVVEKAMPTLPDQQLIKTLQSIERALNKIADNLTPTNQQEMKLGEQKYWWQKPTK